MTKLLIIEDEEILRSILVRALASESLEITEAADGEAGLDAVNTYRPDVVITDMSLPKMTGWELVKAIRANPVTSSIPIIALSAHATAEDRTAAYNVGVSAYEEKPADINRLKSQIAKLIAG